MMTAKFNNLNKDINTLIVIYATCSIDLNLYYACYDVIMMKPAINTNIILQMLRQVHKLK